MDILDSIHLEKRMKDVESQPAQDSSDETYTARNQPSTSKHKQTRIRLAAFSRACDIRDVSNRGAAQLASSLLSDVDQELPENAKLIIVIDKLRR